MPGVEALFCGTRPCASLSFIVSQTSTLEEGGVHVYASCGRQIGIERKARRGFARVVAQTRVQHQYVPLVSPERRRHPTWPHQ